MPIGLFALAVSAFAIGSTEFVIVGLVPEMARDLTVSIPTAGLLVSLYALSITL
jgi:predicted MFS family arabinose efflux permease